MWCVWVGLCWCCGFVVGLVVFGGVGLCGGVEVGGVCEYAYGGAYVSDVAVIRNAVCSETLSMWIGAIVVWVLLFIK